MMDKRFVRRQKRKLKYLRPIVIEGIEYPNRPIKGKTLWRQVKERLDRRRVRYSYKHCLRNSDHFDFDIDL